MGGLLNYLPLRITRPLLGSSGGDYCLNLSSVLHVTLFTSFHSKQILCLFSMCRNWLLISSLSDLSMLKCSDFCSRAGNTSRMSDGVGTSYQSAVRPYFCGAHYFGRS